MKAASCLILAAALAATAAGRAANGVTPVQKVVELLEGMKAKGKAEKHKEMVQFSAYKQFCEDTTASKTQAIKEANVMIEKLKADIEKYTADAAMLGREIAAHDEDINVWTGDIKATTKVRELERADYQALHTDYSESVDALERAIAILKAQAHDRPQAQAASLAQVSTLRLIPKEAKRAIEAFLQQDPSVGLAVRAPEAYGYEFHAHGILEILDKLLEKFIAERTTIEKEEMNTQHAYDMLMQDLKAQIAQATEDRTLKSKAKANMLQAKADALGDLRDTTTTRDADQQYLDELTASCEEKATDFESRQQLRAAEMVAIDKAVAVLSSEAVSGNAATYLPSLVQKGTSLAALRADLASQAQARAAVYLRARAQELESRVLSALAAHVADDPFRKVKKMIKDLIIRLMEEANEEAEHKGWCDMELSTNEQTRKEKTEAVEMMHAEIDGLETSIASLSEDIAELTKAVAELDKAMLEATKLREDEKATNAQTVEDAQEAQTAVAQAMTVLQEFYAKAGEATALLQQQPVAPETWDKPYKGMQAEHGGVVGMLEVIMSDFARLEADTKSAEAAAQKEYETFMTDSKVDKAAKTKDIEHKTAKKQNEQQALVVKKADLEGTQKELNAAMDYFDKLKPSCVDAGVSFESRTTRRKEEIQSLREALRILNGEDMAAA